MPCVSWLLSWVALIIQGIPLLLTGVVLSNPSFPTSIYWACFLSSHVSHCCSTGMVLHGHMCLTAAHWGGLAWFQMLHCCLIGWVYAIPVFLLHLTRVAQYHARLSYCLPFIVVALHCPRYPTAHYFGSPLTQVYHCLSLGWLYLVPGASRLLSGMPLHGTWCFTTAHLGSS